MHFVLAQQFDHSFLISTFFSIFLLGVIEISIGNVFYYNQEWDTIDRLKIISFFVISLCRWKSLWNQSHHNWLRASFIINHYCSEWLKKSLFARICLNTKANVCGSCKNGPDINPSLNAKVGQKIPNRLLFWTFWITLKHWNKRTGEKL